MANPKLSKDEIDKILTLIYTWETKPFDWKLLVERIFAELKIKITRQTLTVNYPRIDTAYHVKKAEFKGSSGSNGTSPSAQTSSNAAMLKDMTEHRDVLLSFIALIQEKSKDNPLLLELLNETTKEIAAKRQET